VRSLLEALADVDLGFAHQILDERFLRIATDALGRVEELRAEGAITACLSATVACFLAWSK
jgi:phosphoserine phosphatase